jgi:hypothetical protein
MNNFDLKKFLVENRLTSNTRRRPIMIDGKEVDRSTIDLDGIDYNDYPDFADAYVMAADFVDGTPLTDNQLEKLTDEYIHDFIEDRLYENRPTSTSKVINEQAVVDVDDYMREDGHINLDVFYRADDESFDQASNNMTVNAFKTALVSEIRRYSQDPGTPPDTTFYLFRVGAIISTDEVKEYQQALADIARQLLSNDNIQVSYKHDRRHKHVYVELKNEVLPEEFFK